MSLPAPQSSPQSLPLRFRITRIHRAAAPIEFARQAFDRAGRRTVAESATATGNARSELNGR